MALTVSIVHTGRGKAAKPTVSTRLERRLKLIERMPAKPKQQLLGLIDTFISAEQNRQGTKP